MTDTLSTVTSIEVEHLADFHIDFHPVQSFLNLGASSLLVYPLEHGVADGERLRGEFLPGGGDWITIQPDRIARLDVRATLQTHDGELVYVTVGGRARLDDATIDRWYSGELVKEEDMYCRTQVLFETVSEKYAWLNSVVCIGFNQFSMSHVDYRIFTVS